MRVSWLLGVAVMCATGVRGAAPIDAPVLSGGERRVVDATWCSLGTSISWYNSHAGASFQKGYQTRTMEQVIFTKLDNRGLNASCVGSAAGAVVPADFYTIEHGINDWGNRVKPADFEANYRKTLAAIRAINPQAKIVLCTPRKGYGFGGYLPDRCDKQQPNGYFLKDYVDVVNKLAKEENLVVADFYSTCGEQDELADLSIDVALHPNDAGYQKMANELTKAILKVYPEARCVKDMKPTFTDDGTPRVVRYDRSCLTASETVVLKGVPIDRVTVQGADMGGNWIPGGPYPCRVECVKRDAATGTLTVQLQSLSPKDAHMRVICLELSQTFRGDVAARQVWARYKFRQTESAYGTDYGEMTNCDGQCGFARDYKDFGYVIGRLILGLNGAIAAPEVTLPLEADKPGEARAVEPETVPMGEPVLLVKNARVADITGFSANLHLAFGANAFAVHPVEKYYPYVPTTENDTLEHDGFYHFKRTQAGDECWARVQIQAKRPGFGGRLLGCLILELVQKGPDIYGSVYDVRYLYGELYGVNGESKPTTNSVRYFDAKDDMSKGHAVFNFSLKDLKLVITGSNPR